MNINVVVTIGTFSCDVTITDCDTLALGDALHQVTTHTLAMVGSDAIHAAAGTTETEST
jgi:hypothetical protein